MSEGRLACRCLIAAPLHVLLVVLEDLLLVSEGEELHKGLVELERTNALK